MRVQLPRPQGVPGREQYGTRPAVVIQSDGTNLSTVILVPLTSNQKAMHLDGSFLVSPTSLNGLTVDSVVLSHQIRAIDGSRIDSVIGHLDDENLTQLENELRTLTGL